MAEAEGLNGGIVATVELVVNDHAHSETCPEGIAEKVFVDSRATYCGNTRVDFGKCSGKCPP